MSLTEQILKLVIQPYKNSQLIKYPLVNGINKIGYSFQYNVNIHNKQIVDNHCTIIISQDQIELIVEDGPVYIKNELGQYILQQPQTSIKLKLQLDFRLNYQQEGSLFRLGQTIEARIDINKKIDQQLVEEQKSKQKDISSEFRLQDELQDLNVKFVQSLYLESQEQQINPIVDKLQQSKQELNQSNNQSNSNIDLIEQHKQSEENEQSIQDQIKLQESITDQQESINNQIIDTMPQNETPQFSNNITKKLKQVKIYQYFTDKNKNKKLYTSPQRKSSKKQNKLYVSERKRMSQRKNGKQVYSIAFSAIKPSKQEIQFLLLQNQNICFEDYNFNILVMEDDVQLRTVKLLIALARGDLIVTKEWINRSINQFKILDPTQYLVKFSQNFNTEYQFNFSQYTKRFQQCQKKKIYPLNNVNIFLPKKIKYHIEHQEIEILVNYLGGKIITVQNQIQESDDIVIFIPRDYKLTGYEKYQQVPIEQLLLSVLQYKKQF